jgi:hypothetical protein
VDSREQFEAHIKSTAWYRVLSDAAKEDDEGASAFRMARMAANEAWQASRRAATEEAAAAVEKHDVAGREWVRESLWGQISREAAARIRALANGGDRE